MKKDIIDEISDHLRGMTPHVKLRYTAKLLHGAASALSDNKTNTCNHCMHFKKHWISDGIQASDGLCNNQSIFVTECDYEFGCNQFET